MSDLEPQRNLIPADRRVYAALISNGCPLTEEEVAVDTGLTHSAVANGVKNLLRDGKVRIEVDQGVALVQVIA